MTTILITETGTGTETRIERPILGERGQSLQAVPTPLYPTAPQSIARRTQLPLGAAYEGWGLDFLHPVYLEDWAQITTGTTSTLPNSPTGQSYTVTSHITTQAPGATTGQLTNGSISIQGLGPVTTGDMLCVAQGGTNYALTNNIAIYLAGSTAYLGVGNLTYVLATGLSGAVNLRLKWLLDGTVTHLWAAAASFPTVPVLAYRTDVAAVLTIAPQINLPINAYSGGLTLWKHAIQINAPTNFYSQPYLLSYTTTAYYETGIPWQTGGVIPPAPSGQTYSGTPTLTAPSFTQSGMATATLGIPTLTIPDQGDFLATSHSVPLAAQVSSGLSFSAASGTNSGGATTLVTVTLNGVPTVLDALTTGPYCVRLSWNMGVVSAGAGPVGALPTLATIGNGHLTQFVYSLTSGSLGGIPPISGNGTSVIVYPYLAQLSVPYIPITLAETGTDHEYLPADRSCATSGIAGEQVTFLIVAFPRDHATSSDTTTTLAYLNSATLAVGHEYVLGSQVVNLHETGSGTDTVANRANIALFTSALGQETMQTHVTLLLTEQGIASGSPTFSYHIAGSGTGLTAVATSATIQLYESGHALETLNGVILKEQIDRATGIDGQRVLAAFTIAETGSGATLALHPIINQDTGTGSETLQWRHYNGQPTLPVLPPTTPTISAFAYLAIDYTTQDYLIGVLQQLQFNTIIPPTPIGATGPLATANVIPQGAQFTFYFADLTATMHTALLGLNGPVMIHFKIPDGRWYTALMTVTVTDTSPTHDGAIVVALLSAPLSLAQTISGAMFY